MHRIGRTGRAGATGIGITFVSTEQAGDVSEIAAELELHREFAASGHASSSRRQPWRRAANSAAARAGARARGNGGSRAPRRLRQGSRANGGGTPRAIRRQLEARLVGVAASAAPLSRRSDEAQLGTARH